VQRWLREQDAQDINVKPTFNPSFVASRRDAPWLLSSLARFNDQKLITDVLHVVRSGKEATVYCCAAHPSTGAEYLAAKVYRPRMFRSLRNDAVYRMNRVQRDEQEQVVHGGSRRQIVDRNTEKGRAARVASWIEYEYQMQRKLYRYEASVPQPFAQLGNAILMEYVGELGEGAPLLSEIDLADDEAQPLFEDIIRSVRIGLDHDCIHGDLSEYNILYWQGEVRVIDWAQAVNPQYNTDVFALLLRDIERVCRYFALYGVKANAYALAKDMWIQHMGPTHPM
jgi:RIO kinase 1